MSAISASASGLQAAALRFTRAAETLARAPAGTTDEALIEPIADMIEAKHQFSANAHAINVTDEMLRQLVDIRV